MSQSNKNESYRNFGTYRSIGEPDAALRDYWWSRTPEERMGALEELRVRICGEDVINAPLVRSYGWRKSIKNDYDPKNVVYF